MMLTITVLDDVPRVAERCKSIAIELRGHRHVRDQFPDFDARDKELRREAQQLADFLYDNCSALVYEYICAELQKRRI